MRIQPADKLGWYEITEIYEDELRQLKRLPGYEILPGKILVPHNLVVAKPQLFGAVVDEITPLDCEILRPYQREVAGLVRAREGSGALLALTMGSGKTISATMSIAYKRDPVPRTLILGPLMSRGSWCGENSDPYKFAGIDVAYLEGVKNASLANFPSAQWVFCHYDILDAWFGIIVTHFKPEAIIADEMHICRNKKALRSKKVLALTRLHSVKYRVALTGTPVLNSIMDLWAQLDFVAPDAWGKRHEFGQRYTAVEFTEYGPKYVGEANTLELQKRLDTLMYRKDRSELLAQLPSFTRQAIPAELDSKSQEEYTAVFLDIRKYLREKVSELVSKMSGEKLVALTKLTELVGLGKVRTTVELCVDALQSHDKAVIFCWHKSTAKKIKQGLARKQVAVYGPVSGEMPAKKRFALMDRFAEDPDKAVFIATIASAGIALNNLVAASCVIFNDLYWLPGPLLQAEARVHRDGQVRGVNAYYVYGPNTVDEQMLDAIFTKANAIEAASAGDEATGLATTFVGDGEEQSALDALCDFLMS